MADPTSAASVPSQAGPSRTSSRHDMEGLGKFKLSNAAPRGNSYKGKFFVLKETYDVVTSRREDLRKELEVANMRLKAVQAENDLLLDAMQIVTPSQPSLVGILQQIEPEPLSASTSLGGGGGGGGGAEIFAGPPRPAPVPHPQSGYAPLNLPEQRPGHSMDAAALNGNGNGNGYTHHAPVHPVNGRARAREYRERDEPADEEMLDDDALLTEHERDRNYPAPPPGTGTHGRR